MSDISLSCLTLSDEHADSGLVGTCNTFQANFQLLQTFKTFYYDFYYYHDSDCTQLVF